MARQFSHPQVKTLEVGESTSVYNTDSEVLQRRVDGYAKRAGRRFHYAFNVVADNTHQSGHLVTRLPDPEPQP